MNPVLMQGEITSRKQPGRGAKKTSEREIPIQAATAPDAAATAEAEQGVPPLMSTHDYLEEAEELLAHPVDPTDLQTQPEVMRQHLVFQHHTHALGVQPHSLTQIAACGRVRVGNGLEV